MNHDIGNRVDAADTEIVIALGDQVPCFEFDPRVALRKVIEIIPMRGRRLTVQQACFCEQVAGSPHGADPCAGGGVPRYLW